MCAKMELLVQVYRWSSRTVIGKRYNQMMVTTKYCGPTNTRGSKIRVLIFDQHKTMKNVEYRYELNSNENHEQAIIDTTGGLTPRFIGEFENGTMVWEL